MELEVVAVPKLYPREGDPNAPHAYYVYFLYCAGRVKIGRAGFVKARVSEFATGCPFPQMLLLSVSGSLTAERDLHARFAEDRVHREWFRLSNYLRRYLVKRMDEAGLAAFRKAEDDYLGSLLPVPDTPRKWKKPPKRCEHGNPRSRSCAKCTREADMRVYDVLVKKMQAEDYYS